MIDPTANVFERLLVARPGAMLPGYDDAQDLPVEFRHTLTTGGLPVPAGMDARYRASFGAVLRMVRLLYDSNVPLVAGTDGLPGFSLVHELELYESAGIPDTAILRIATINAARTMHMDRELGTISVGKRADMIVVDDDPTQRISALRTVRTVIKGGAYYDVNALRAALGIGRPGGAAGDAATACSGCSTHQARHITSPQRPSPTSARPVEGSGAATMGSIRH